MPRRVPATQKTSLAPIAPSTRSSEDLAAAFLLAYQGHTRSAYANDLREWFSLKPSQSDWRNRDD